MGTEYLMEDYMNFYSNLLTAGTQDNGNRDDIEKARVIYKNLNDAGEDVRTLRLHLNKLETKFEMEATK